MSIPPCKTHTAHIRHIHLTGRRRWLVQLTNPSSAAESSAPKTPEQLQSEAKALFDQVRTDNVLCVGI